VCEACTIALYELSCDDIFYLLDVIPLSAMVRGGNTTWMCFTVEDVLICEYSWWVDASR
jgi:hypothetical protein